MIACFWFVNVIKFHTLIIVAFVLMHVMRAECEKYMGLLWFQFLCTVIGPGNLGHFVDQVALQTAQSMEYMIVKFQLARAQTSLVTRLWCFFPAPTFSANVKLFSPIRPSSKFKIFFLIRNFKGKSQRNSYLPKKKVNGLSLSASFIRQLRGPHSRKKRSRLPLLQWILLFP